jgi:hypothetical protein
MNSFLCFRGKNQQRQMTKYAEFSFWGDPSTIEAYYITNTDHPLSTTFADLVEVMLLITPHFPGSDAMLADRLKTFITNLGAGDTGPPSAYRAFPSDFISPNYCTTRFTTY